MDRRVAILRFWLWCVVALALMVWRPEPLWLAVPLFFPGQAGCFCCAAAGVCTYCSGSTYPPIIKLVVSGVVNGTCSDCAAFNAEWLIPEFGSGANCNWLYDETDIPCDGPADNIQVVFSLVLGFVFAAVSFRYSSTDEMGFSGSPGTNPTDCSDFTGNNSYTPGSGGTFCDATAATCSLENV